MKYLSFKLLQFMTVISLSNLFIQPTLALEKKYPLDIQLEQCMEKDSTTVGMMTCTQNFRQKWDLELNRYYQLLGGNKNTSLKQAQLAWIKFKDQEFKRIETLYQTLGKHGGTIWGLMAGGDKLEVIKSRALTLKQNYDLLTCGMECK